ncbi:MAG: hypothetical protein KUG69_08470 [Marinosulfonomonas sp.]|nr:hypothetical protein [Marinosulfonomonas sp.]
MQKNKANKMTRREAMTRLGVVATAGYIVPGLAAFSAAHASSASSSSDSSDSSDASEVSEATVASAATVASVVSKASLPSLPSDAGITEDQKAAYEKCGDAGGDAADCLGEADIKL